MTAEDFLKSKGVQYEHEVTGMSAYVRNAGSTINATKKLMIEFAQYHVKRALARAASKTEHHYANKDWVDKNSILSAYPLEEIK